MKHEEFFDEFLPNLSFPIGQGTEGDFMAHFLTSHCINLYWACNGMKIRWGFIGLRSASRHPFALFKENNLLKKALACAVILCSATAFVLLNSAQSADLTKSKALYEERCLLCHGPKGDGKGHSLRVS
jgi:hypothetical protein